VEAVNGCLTKGMIMLGSEVSISRFMRISSKILSIAP